MKGITSSWILLIVVGFASQQFDTATAAYTMNETCLYIQEGFIANPASCQSYGYCSNGALVSLGECPSGTYYNADEGVCQYTSNCRVSTTDVCQGSTETKYVANPLNCSQYYYCQNGISTTYSCPKYQVFDPINTVCNWASEVSVSCEGTSICLLVQNNIFAADPNFCGNYILCNKGNGISTPCADGKFFNPRTGKCQTVKYCPNTEDNSSGHQKPNFPNDPTKCKNQPDGQKTFVSDGATCYGYYICTGKSEGGIWAKCPLGTHFSEGKCVTPYTYACPFDRCGNTNATFMGAIESNCQNYLNCNNGESIYSPVNGKYVGKQCGQNYYFDEYFQQCVQNNPTKNTNYKLCPAAPAPPSGK